MATNSDSLYYVLSKLKRHPDLLTFQAPQYDNAVRFSFPDTVKIGDANDYFPDSRIINSLLSQQFIAKNGDLLDYYFQHTNAANPDYKQVWLMSSHLPDQGVYMVDLSFE